MADLLYYKIIKTELVQFATLVNTFDPNGHYSQNNEISIDFNPASSVLNCTLSILLQDSAQCPVMKASVLCSFEFKRESIETITKNGEVKFPVNVLCHLVSLTYSSLRGALSVKAEDTPFRGFVLPITNVSEYIKSPVTFKLQEN